MTEKSVLLWLAPVNSANGTPSTQKVLLVPQTAFANLMNTKPVVKENKKTSMFKCSKCHKSFYFEKYLKEHERRIHGEMKDEHDVGKVKCKLCEKRFNTQAVMGAHMRRVHGERKYGRRIKCQEAPCNESFHSLAGLRNHLNSVHKLPNICNEQVLKFNTKKEFQDWLDEEEARSKSHYTVEYCHTNPRDCFSITVMNCHRSGVYKSDRKERKRQLKAQGSIKLGFSCTAQIRIKEHKGYLEVSYFPEHYRHEKSLCHLPLSKADKQIIAEKLLQGLDERKILQDLRLSMNTGMERRHLATRKDINNIKRDFSISQLNKSSTVQNDEKSVYAWVQEMRQTNYNPVLFYKRQNEEAHGIDSNEFLLILMTMFQRNVICEFNYDRVCIDVISGICNYGFDIVILYAVDEEEEGVPIAYSITSSVNRKMLHTFFNCIKNVIPEIKPKIFISEDNPIYYDVWKDVFKPCEANVISSWCVEQAWRRNLSSTVRKKEKKEQIQCFLKKLLYELDEEVFQETMDEFLQLLNQSDETAVFCNFFRTYYYERTHMWAYCFRKCKRSVVSNMNIETFHKNLKRWYLDPRINRRVDNCIIKLINMANDTKFDDFVKSKGKKIKEEHENYDDDFIANDNDDFISNDNDDSTLNDNIENVEWDIVSESGASYRVSKNNVSDHTSRQDNPMKFNCSCHMSSTSHNSCKHIDFVVNYINSTRNSTKKVSLESLKSQLASLNRSLQTIQNIDDKTINEMHLLLNKVGHLLDPFLQETSIASTCELTSENFIEPVEFFSVKKQKLMGNESNEIVNDEEHMNADILLKKIANYDSDE